MKLIEFTKLRKNQWNDVMELNKKIVPNWFSYNSFNEMQEETNWVDLSPRERFYHGGPWTDPSTLKVYLDLFLKFGDVLIGIDSRTEELIAEIEFHFTGNYIHIDWMMVAPKLQNQGIGSKLVKKIEEIALEFGFQELQTEPEKGTQYFYESNGFTNNLPKIIQSTKKGSSDELGGWNMGIPSFRNLIGDAFNTPKYSEFLLKAEIEYAKIFKKPMPISWKKISDNTTAIKRQISVFNDRSSLLISSDDPGNRVKLFSFFNEIVGCIPKKEKTFVSLLENLIPTWDKFNEIQKLIKTI